MEQKELSLTQLKAIYTPCLARDFPPDELMPFHRMEALTQAKSQVALGFYNSQGLAAYAIFILRPGSPAALLNYFAVQPHCRGQGMGTACLRQLGHAAQNFGAGYVVFEVESPSHASSPADRKIRQKRVGFYLQGGAKATSVSSWLYGVDYNIMILPGQAPPAGNRQIKEDLEDLYHIVVPSRLSRGRAFSDVCRVWYSEGGGAEA